MKKALFFAALALSALAAPAANYFVVVPFSGKTAPVAPEAIKVALGGYALPLGWVSVPYDGFDFKSVLQVSGDPAYSGSKVTWSIVSGNLPAGVQLKADGTLMGTPTGAATYNFTVRAEYKTKTGEMAYQLVAANLTVGLAAAALPEAEVGSAYSYDFKPLATSNDPMFTGENASFSANTLPTGLSLGMDGVLTGTPQAPNPGASFQVVATYKGKEGQQAYTIVVNGTTLKVSQIATGYYHTCAVTLAGGVKCWGANGYGQLGNNSTTNSKVPVDVVGLTSGVKSITAGTRFSCAVTAAGGAKCWGTAVRGALPSSLVPVDVAGLTSGVASIHASYGSPTYPANRVCVITAGGGVKCWGRGYLGNGSTASSDAPVAVIGLETGVVNLAVSDSHICAVTAAGGAKCWGANSRGSLGNNSIVDSTVPVDVVGLASGVTAIAAGNSHTCAVTTSGAVKCWGYNGWGQVGNNSSVDSLIPVDVVGLASGFTAIAAGDSSSCALSTAGGVKCWGVNSQGQLGNGSTTYSKVPVDVSGLSSEVTKLAMGNSYVCALLSSSKIKCWGENSSAQFGNDTTVRSKVPVDAAL